MFDKDGFLCHPDGTQVTMKMTWGTRTILRALAWLRTLRQR